MLPDLKEGDTHVNKHVWDRVGVTEHTCVYRETPGGSGRDRFMVGEIPAEPEKKSWRH